MKFLHRQQPLLRSLVATAAVSFPLACTPVAMGQTGDFDPEDRGSKVEDDAWYDISEWFDGNDYNPTDEAIGRWDDEIFSYEDARTSSDSDNDQLIIPPILSMARTTTKAMCPTRIAMRTERTSDRRGTSIVTVIT